MPGWHGSGFKMHKPTGECVSSSRLTLREARKARLPKEAPKPLAIPACICEAETGLNPTQSARTEHRIGSIPSLVVVDATYQLQKSKYAVSEKSEAQCKQGNARKGNPRLFSSKIT